MTDSIPPREVGALVDTVAVVTGASRGIGRAVATRLARGGAKVGLLARSRESLEDLSRVLDGWSVPCDVTSPDDLTRAVERIEELAGRPPDLLVAAAGVFDLAPAEETLPEVIHRNLDVNLKGGMLTVTHFLPAFLARGAGTIVQVGSVAGRRALPGNAAYAASKFGIRGFHEVLVEELRGTGVRATLLEPAATDTSIWDPVDPDGRADLPNRSSMLRPEEVAEAVYFVATRPPGVQIPFLPIERT
jgi:NADP-dependent 3-hydroxy acid dehydrogenase YdfG